MKVQSFICLLSIILWQEASAFYFSGEEPQQSFASGDVVKLKVNKMTSAKTLMSVDYYRLPFCQPEGGPKMDNENVGEFLAGDRIKSSPYRLQMKKDMYCERVCITNLGRGEHHAVRPNKVVQAIRKNYHNNWIVDNLSSASKSEDLETITTRYWGGFPVGYVGGNDQKAYINNHVNIEIMYHPVEMEVDEFRVVKFTVEPFSIQHSFEPLEDNDDDDNDYDTNEEEKGAKVAKFIKPIMSCAEGNMNKHTNYDVITAAGPQLASGKVLFTYDVIWKENKELKWTNRWDIYLSMDNAIPLQLHWLSIAYPLIIVVVLSVMITAILVQKLRSTFAKYSRLGTDVNNAEDLKEFGWKSVHADIFRPPSFSPLLLSCACGTGAQILAMSFLTIIFSIMGFLSPSNRGALLMAVLLLYATMGGIAGYVTARLYKTFNGKSWEKATALTAFGFLGIFFLFFVFLDHLAVTLGSRDAAPFKVMVTLLVLWFGISTPLVFFGAYFGYKQDAIEFPVNTSSIPRQIPDQPWFLRIPFTLVIGGMLPFAACYVELLFILASVWEGQYYDVFGILLLVFFILLLTSAEITILICYWQLCRENYHWWWRSFCTAGSIALYIFFYSFMFFREQFEANEFATYMLFFGYMGLVSLGLFMMMGFVGVASLLWFNKTIFRSMKIIKNEEYNILQEEA